MALFGKLIHIGFDAMLIAALLAAVKRNCGLTLALEQVHNKEFRRLLNTYLEAGEYTFDFIVVFLGRSSSFKRLR